MDIKVDFINHDLRKPDSVTVVCGKHKREFLWEEKSQVRPWLESIWKEEEEKNFGLFYSEAVMYYNIDWDSDNVIYCKINVA